MSKENNILSPEEIRKRVEELRLERHSARQQMLEAKSKVLRISREIEEIQSICPHANIKEDFSRDVMEMKLQHFCTDCGKELCCVPDESTVAI